jgi:hypothetical protein
MRSFLFTVAVLLFVLTCKSQYYYNDIVAGNISQKQYMVLKANHIHHVSAISYESNGEATEDFKLDQEISPEAKTIIVHSSYPSSGNSTTINNYKFNKLVETADSSANVSNITKYEYDSAGRISTVLTVSEDTFMNSRSEELHQWFYKNDLPSYMLRIKDNADTTLVEFTYDDAANIGQENWKRKGKTVEIYYYYYNDAKQLTDIVRYNQRAKQMLPDFLYQYDAAGRMTQLVQIPPGNSDYMIWKYVYNPDGLKKSEFLFDKEKQLVGHIDYTYE